MPAPLHSRLGLLAVFLAATPLHAQQVRPLHGTARSAAQRPDEASELLRFVRAIDDASATPDVRSATFLRDALAADFVRTGTDGGRQNRAETLAHVLQPTLPSRPIERVMRDVRLVVAGDAAYVTYLTRTRAPRATAGEDTLCLRMTDVLVRRPGRWTLVAEHASRVPSATMVPPGAPAIAHVTVDAASPGDSAALAARYPGSGALLTRAAKIARYDSTMTEDFISLRQNGTTSGKAATIARWTPPDRPGGGDERGSWSHISGARVRTYGGLAVVQLTDTQYDSTGHVEFVVHTTDVLRKERGTWRVAVLQATTASETVVASEDSASVVALEWAIVHASTRRDAAALDSLVDSSFVGTVFTGRQFGKRQVITRWTALDTSGESSVLSDIVVHRFQGGAFAELLDSQHARNGEMVRASRAVDLFARDGAQWRLVAGLAMPGAALADTAAARAVRDARTRWNAAVAGTDTSALRRLLMDSVAQASHVFRHVGASPYLEMLARVAARRPGLAWRFESEHVEANGASGYERGQWTERWLERGEPTELSGIYHAIWRRVGERWQLAAELFAPTRCTGAAYCGR